MYGLLFLLRSFATGSEIEKNCIDLSLKTSNLNRISPYFLATAFFPTNPKSMSDAKLFRVQQEAQQTATKLQQVCINLQQRQETLENLDLKAIDLEGKAKVFEKSARDLRRQQMCRRLRIVASILLLIILIIILVVWAMGGFNRQ